MESFEWDEHFVTDLQTVDHQHLQLVGMVNEFGTLLTENRLLEDDLEAVFSKLAAYARYHFREEESLMRRVGVDPRHLQHHVEIHHGFLQEVAANYAGISRDNTDSAKYLMEFLTHWLAYHILGEDQDMARQIKAIESGMEPWRAYEQEERQRDRSTKPLLKALNNLFTQVSERNRALVSLNLSLEQKVAQRTRELNEANRHLEELSLTDTLTGLPNRRHAMRRLSDLWNESVEHSLPLVCMMIDADHFKQVNDTYGHDAGDLVLSKLARTLRSSVRTDDVVCRLGGDEFFIICPNTDREGGLLLAEAIRRHVSKLRVATGGEPWVGSISVGIACRSDDSGSHESLMKLADEGVYIAKRDGKNCVRMKAPAQAAG